MKGMVGSVLGGQEIDGAKGKVKDALPSTLPSALHHGLTGSKTGNCCLPRAASCHRGRLQGLVFLLCRGQRSLPGQEQSAEHVASRFQTGPAGGGPRQDAEWAAGHSSPGKPPPPPISGHLPLVPRAGQPRTLSGFISQADQLLPSAAVWVCCP